MPSLHKVLKNSYASKDKQKSAYKNYVYDEGLSNGNQQVYFNPKNKKLLLSVTGTHNLSDWGTDAYLAAGKLKDTNRYKEADSILKKAKSKYNVNEATVAGHSLGGGIGQYIAGSNDKVFTLDKGATIGQKTRANENAYRSSGDVVSLLNANSTRMKTLKNNKAPGVYSAVGGLIGGPLGYLAGQALESHNVDNIKNEKIFI